MHFQFIIRFRPTKVRERGRVKNIEHRRRFVFSIVVSLTLNDWSRVFSRLHSTAGTVAWFPACASLFWAVYDLKYTTVAYLATIFNVYLTNVGQLLHSKNSLGERARLTLIGRSIAYSKNNRLL